MSINEAAKILNIPSESVRLFVLLTKSLQTNCIEENSLPKAENLASQPELLESLMEEYRHRI